MTAIKAYNCKSTSLELVNGGKSSCKGRGALDPCPGTSGQRTRRINATVFLSSASSVSTVLLRRSVRDSIRLETLGILDGDVVAAGLNGEGPLRGRLVVIASPQPSVSLKIPVERSLFKVKALQWRFRPTCRVVVVVVRCCDCDGCGSAERTGAQFGYREGAYRCYRHGRQWGKDSSKTRSKFSYKQNCTLTL
jgi:hypothetical protein